MFTSLSSWNTLHHPARLDHVFANRLKEYGAYTLRGNYESVLTRALLLTLLLFSGMALLVLLPESATQEKAHTETILVQEVILPEKTIVPETAIKPPAQPNKAPTGSKFTTPVVHNENKADSVLAQDLLSLKGVGSVDSSHTDSIFTDEFPPFNPVSPEIKTFTWVEEMPQFPGGETEMLNFLRKSIRYPEKAVTKGISGTVYLQFVVGTDGEIRSLKTLNTIGGGCDEEALRVVGSMPHWKPGRQNGKAVPVEYMLPIRFSLK